LLAQERFEVPGDWIVVWLKLQAMPLGGETARVTGPVNPLIGVMAMDDMPDSPAVSVEGETAPAETVKSEI
jgi:hypothetical protein